MAEAEERHSAAREKHFKVQFGMCEHSISLVQVMTWLELMFAPEPVPTFEMNDYTMSYLYALCSLSTERARQADVMLHSVATKAVEYELEGCYCLPWRLTGQLSAWARLSRACACCQRASRRVDLRAPELLQAPLLRWS